MNAADELIERMERETGCRVDANGGDNPAMDGLFGAVSRILDRSSRPEEDDVAAGMLIRYQMTPEYKREQQAEMLAALIASGIDPNDVKRLFG